MSLSNSSKNKSSFPPLSAVVFSSRALRYSVPWGLTVLLWVCIFALGYAVLHGVGL